MKLLGFYIGGHDSNVSLCDANGNISYFKLERILQSKHKKGNIEWVEELCKKNEFVPDYICFSDGNRNGLGICAEELLWQEIEPLDIFKNVKTYCIDHHYAHILSAFPIIGDRVDYGVCVDGRGDYQFKSSVFENPFDIYKCKMIYGSKEDSYCLMFNEIGKLMKLSGGELDFAGKVMGAQAYGKVNDEYIARIQKYAEENGVSETLKMDYFGKKIEDLCLSKNCDFFDWLASYHKWIQFRIFDLMKQIIPEKSIIVYAGGGAQNTVYNNYFLDHFNLVIPPHCYDGGLSLGCLKLLSEIIGKKMNIESFPYCHSDEDLGYASQESIDRVVELLANGKIVGWCQGRSEIGPRALGHRSILMNPAIKNAKDILNNRIKKRESWRPFAASILREDVEKITGKSLDLKYMLHAVSVEPGYKEMLRSVVHVDGTCRFQAVDDTAELHSYYKLIKQFKEKTGIYGILNTSYNSSGMPIASSRKDIMNAFELLDLDALCVGDKLIIGK